MNKLVVPISLLCLTLLMTIACASRRVNYGLEDFCKWDGSPFSKIDNPAAANASFDELMTLLNELDAKGYEFADLPGNCGYYAEAVHNEAEANGIRAAIVFAFVGEGVHIFNAFDTTHKGRIYADMTGGTLVIAENTNGQYRFIKYEGNQTRIQELGSERDFYVFW